MEIKKFLSLAAVAALMVSCGGNKSDENSDTLMAQVDTTTVETEDTTAAQAAMDSLLASTNEPATTPTDLEAVPSEQATPAAPAVPAANIEGALKGYDAAVKQLQSLQAKVKKGDAKAIEESQKLIAEIEGYKVVLDAAQATLTPEQIKQKAGLTTAGDKVISAVNSVVNNAKDAANTVKDKATEVAKETGKAAKDAKEAVKGKTQEVKDEGKKILEEVKKP